MNDGLESVGRANTKILELNSVVELGGSEHEIVQQGSNVFVVDQDSASVSIVDATTSEVVETVPVPPGETTLALAGDRVLVITDGELRTMPAASLNDFDAQSEPALNFGAGAVASVDPEGVLFAFTPSTGEVARVDAASEEKVAARWQAEPIADDHAVQITSVDQHWVVLDATAQSLTIDGRSVDLSEVLVPGEDVRLQEPASAGESVAIAHRRGLRVSHTLHVDQPAVRMAAPLTEALAAALAATGRPVHRMISGAGHDAMIVARKVPAAMLFLRSPGGISHHPDERVLEDDVAAALEAGVHWLTHWGAHDA